ncbi:hypothetical protein ACIBCN_09140 [Nocardia sp. NPDC051052]|uniref:hypothetical protein n=1 Tax=Nocardia sp. NPDC051052 TaxID=3364322 RepID=UPI0037B5801F
MITLVATAGLAMVTGCSPSQPSASPASTQARSQMTQGELCNVLMNFFTNELHAVDVRTAPVVSAETTVVVSGLCEVTQGQNPVGNYQVRHAPNDSDPTEGRRGYEKKPDLGDAVWIYDLRADERNPSNTVRFATRINQWNGVLEVRDTETLTANGGLHLTDDDKRKSVQFVTELTTKLAAR